MEALDVTRRDYDAAAIDYAAAITAPGALEPFGQLLIEEFARRVGPGGRVLDAGCGPGHQTARLADLGLRASGIDASPRMIELARAARPDLPFAVGSLLAVEYPGGSLDGVLAHFSLIHTPPADVPAAAAELARVLGRGGQLLLGAFTGDDGLTGWQSYAHRVSPGFRWSFDALAAIFAAVGFVELVRARVPPVRAGRAPGGYLWLRLADDDAGAAASGD